MSKSRIWRQALEEFEQNRRLRLGLWAIGLILLVYVSMLLAEVQSELKAEFYQLLTKAQDMASVSEQKQWLRRSEEARASRIDAEAEFWVSRSEGLAQATYQTWLDRQLGVFHVEDARIQMLPVESREGKLNLWKVSARIQANARASDLQRFLFKLESLDRVTIVDTLTIRNDRKKSFDMVATAWFRMTI